MFTLSAFDGLKLEAIDNSTSPEKLLNVFLESAWEMPAKVGPLCIVTDDQTGVCMSCAFVVEVFSDTDGIVEIYRPEQAVERQRIAYHTDAHGQYERTERTAA